MLATSHTCPAENLDVVPYRDRADHNRSGPDLNTVSYFRNPSVRANGDEMVDPKVGTNLPSKDIGAMSMLDTEAQADNRSSDVQIGCPSVVWRQPIQIGLVFNPVIKEGSEFRECPEQLARVEFQVLWARVAMPIPLARALPCSPGKYILSQQETRLQTDKVECTLRKSKLILIHIDNTARDAWIVIGASLSNISCPRRE
jgi:hypothetical protein